MRHEFTSDLSITRIFSITNLVSVAFRN